MQASAVGNISADAKRSWPTGYSMPMSADIKSCFGRYKRTSLSKTILTSLLDLLTICAVAGMDHWLFDASSFFWLPVGVISLIIIARAQRGLECLVHEGSHYNWSRVGAVNDALVNLLAALPVFSLVQRYRESHKIHHSNFGSALDVDRQRYEQLGIDDLDRSSAKSFLQGMATRLPRYILSWWRAIGFNVKGLFYSLTWHAVVFILPLAIAFGFKTSLALWLRYWLLPIMIVLPVIRFIGEAGEHIYRNTDNVLDATVSNYGLLHGLLIHPHNDGYHLLHHLTPTVPHFNLKKAHAFLSTADALNYGMRHRHRSRILQVPEP